MTNYINNLILKEASKLQYTVKAVAPSTVEELFQAPTLVVWSGASDHTIFGSKHVNWAFRALHDQLHLETRLGFTVAEEIELGRIQANLWSRISPLLGDLAYIEVAEQAKYYLKNGIFIVDQVTFTKDMLTKLGYKGV